MYVPPAFAEDPAAPAALIAAHRQATLMSHRAGSPAPWAALERRGNFMAGRVPAP